MWTGALVLLPVDPDASARPSGPPCTTVPADVAVIASTHGRPWRTGLTDVALGAAGIDASSRYRADRTRHGNELHSPDGRWSTSSRGRESVREVDQYRWQCPGIGRDRRPGRGRRRSAVRLAGTTVSLGTPRRWPGRLGRARLSDVDGFGAGRGAGRLTEALGRSAAGLPVVRRPLRDKLLATGRVRAATLSC